MRIYPRFTVILGEDDQRVEDKKRGPFSNLTTEDRGGIHWYSVYRPIGFYVSHSVNSFTFYITGHEENTLTNAHRLKRCDRELDIPFVSP